MLKGLIVKVLYSLEDAAVGNSLFCFKTNNVLRDQSDYEPGVKLFVLLFEKRDHYVGFQGVFAPEELLLQVFVA